MTAIYTSQRIAGLISAGKVRHHLAPAQASDGDARSTWGLGKSHPVRSPGRPSSCRVITQTAELAQLSDLQPRDLHDTGHRTTLALAQWWMRSHIARHNRHGEQWADSEVLARFNARYLQHWCWVVTFILDVEHTPRLLHADPAQNYTHLPQLAAAGEPEAVSAREIERGTEAARQRHRAHIGLMTQSSHNEKATLEERLRRVLEQSRKSGTTVRDELRVIDQRIHRIEQKLAREGDAA